MNLPDVSLQWAMLRIGWGVVLACVVVEALCRFRRAPSRSVLGLAAGVALACPWLPGPASPAFWLGLAFQWPSNLLVLLGGTRLLQRLAPRAPPGARSREGVPDEPLLPLFAALLLAAAGIILYLGTFGVGPFVYRSGYFDSAVLAFVTLAVAGWRWGGLAMPRTSLLFALAIGVHLLTRLPTGNAWDALIDPFVVVLSLVTCARAALTASRARALAWREPAVAAIAEPPAGGAAKDKGAR